MPEKLKAAFRQVVGRDRKKSRERERYIRICMGDATSIDRLVQYERSRSPSISYAGACRRAIQSYLGDHK